MHPELAVSGGNHPAHCLLLLGSNQGDKVDLLRQAREQIAQHAGNIRQQSSLYESEPWGFVSSDWFINQVIEIETNIPPFALLRIVQHIEKTLGRRRTTGRGYASRTIDIDLLFYDNWIIESATLTIPHPRLHERMFTLLPLFEIAPDWLHPRLKRNIADLLAACPDRGRVYLTKN